MAGLLDIFGTGGTGALSLLGGGDIEQARNDAQAQALYALAGRLFQGGSTGQSIAEGLQMGQQAYKQAMQGELSDRLTQFQLQEFKRKREEELASKLRAEQARKALMGAYVPPQAGTPELPPTTYGYEDVAVPGTYGVEGKAATPARYDLSKVAPALMSGAYGPEGLSLLTQMLQMEKLGRPEFHALPEGSTGIAYDPSSQRYINVATGAPKEKPTPAEIQGYQLAQSQGYKGSFLDYQTVLKMAGAQKLAIDLKDPTAVAKQRIETIGKAGDFLKTTGEQVSAGRASLFYDAYRQATKDQNASADGALIYHIAKMYDSTGAVQQGDVKTIIGNRSLPTEIELAARKLSSGGTFTPQERKNLKSIVDGYVKEKYKQVEITLEPFRSINLELGGKKGDILNPYEDVRKSSRSLDEILGI